MTGRGEGKQTKEETGHIRNQSQCPQRPGPALPLLSPEHTPLSLGGPEEGPTSQAASSQLACHKATGQAVLWRETSSFRLKSTRRRG